VRIALRGTGDLMANQGQNEGFRVLDDFMCEAINDPTIPKSALFQQGQNEGIRVVEDFVVDLGNPDRKGMGRGSDGHV
jgi:hypothetical protein